MTNIAHGLMQMDYDHLVAMPSQDAQDTHTLLRTVHDFHEFEPPANRGKEFASVLRSRQNIPCQPLAEAQLFDFFGIAPVGTQTRVITPHPRRSSTFSPPSLRGRTAGFLPAELFLVALLGLYCQCSVGRRWLWAEQ